MPSVPGVGLASLPLSGIASFCDLSILFKDVGLPQANVSIPLEPI